MLRKRNLPTREENGRQNVADFFGIAVSEVSVEPQPQTFSIRIAGNEEAQKQYKIANPWGNTSIPKKYDFTGSLLVRWTGSKVQVL